MSGAERMTRKAAPQRSEHRGIVHVLTCGSVDDGKSTLIGRLLWDAPIFRTTSATWFGARQKPQAIPKISITASCSTRSSQNGSRASPSTWLGAILMRLSARFVLIDSPGHVQYTRNMASGASHADAAVMLIDARHGLKQQTRRHAAILSLMGVPRVVSPSTRWIWLTGAKPVSGRSKPPSSRRWLRWVSSRRARFRFRPGKEITSRTFPRTCRGIWEFHSSSISKRLPSRSGDADFRMPVQTVLRDGQDFRGLAGTVTSGIVRVGDEVADALTGRTARVARIVTMTGDLAEAAKGKAIVLVLDVDIDVARGAVPRHIRFAARQGARRRSAPCVAFRTAFWRRPRPLVANRDRCCPGGQPYDQRSHRSRHAVAQASRRVRGQ